ncbi:MAG: hypothetical protein ABIH08_00705, partial [Candidatus Omnitrophota bacterium]
AVIYRGLKPYSIESIIFFYAYYPLKILRRNIDYFLDELKDTDLRVRGEDFKKLGFKPLTLYNKLFQRLLYAKIEKGLKDKEEEIKEAKVIFERLSKKTED